ncbi:MAG: hypothetical protein QM737_02905 [Ferruginibacter sp.]
MNKTSTASFEAIQTAIKTLTDKGIKPTQKNVSAESGLSIRTVKTYWARVQGSLINEDTRVQTLPVEQDDRVQDLNDATPNRVQVADNRVQSSKPSTSFERLKQRKRIDETIPYRPWLKP